MTGLVVVACEWLIVDWSGYIGRSVCLERKSVVVATGVVALKCYCCSCRLEYGRVLKIVTCCSL